MHSILAFSPNNQSVHCGDTATMQMACSVVFKNFGGDWVSCLEGQQGVNRNFSADPLFCDPDNGVLTLRSDSPCAPPGEMGCGLIGALGVACGPTALAETSWGVVKAKFRGR